MPRLFMALRVQPTRELERVLGRMRDVRGIAAVRPENLHYTLRFLGHVDDSGAQDLRQALTARPLDVAPFEVPVKGTSAFPDERRPRVIWAGCAATAHAPLAALARAVDGCAEACGFGARDKPFVPHLTLARVKVKGGRGMETAQDIVREESGTDYGVASARSVHLVESRLTPAGAVYSDLAEVQLG